MNDKLVQIELWLDCPVNCRFCCLGKFKKITSDTYKISIMEKAINLLDEINWGEYDKLAIIGCEIFYGEYSPQLAELFNKFIEKIIIFLRKNVIKRFYIMTSLMYLNNYFYNMIEQFKEWGLSDKILICSSYDTKYRFNQVNKIEFDKNVKYLNNNKIGMHFEIILTQFFIDDYMNKNNELMNIISNYPIDILRPARSWKMKKEDQPQDFFPKRVAYMQWLSDLKGTNKELLFSLFDMKNRASLVYCLSNGTEIVRGSNNIDDIQHNINQCGHDDLYCCYGDSDECIVCDTNKFKRLIECEM